MSEAELILAKLKIVSETEERGMYLCDKEHSKILLDYITNLQSKIEAYELFDNQKIANLQEEKDSLDDYNRHLHNELKDYKSRCEKATEHLKEVMKDEEEYEEDYIYNKYLLDILQGEKNE